MVDAFYTITYKLRSPFIQNYTNILICVFIAVKYMWHMLKSLLKPRLCLIVKMVKVVLTSTYNLYLSENKKKNITICHFIAVKMVLIFKTVLRLCENNERCKVDRRHFQRNVFVSCCRIFTFSFSFSQKNSVE